MTAQCRQAKGADTPSESTHVVPEMPVVSSAALPSAAPRPLARAAVDAAASPPPPSCHVTDKPEVVERDGENIVDTTRRANRERKPSNGTNDGQQQTGSRNNDGRFKPEVNSLASENRVSTSGLTARALTRYIRTLPAMQCAEIYD